MKKTAFLLLTIVLASCSLKSNRGTHELNIVCNTTNTIKIKSVDITDDFTKINFEHDGSVECGAYPPGHENAFFIKDVTTDKVYKLTNIEGIAISPSRGITRQFTLTFEMLPKDLFQFHVVEGNVSVEGAWTFMNVTILKK